MKSKVLGCGMMALTLAGSLLAPLAGNAQNDYNRDYNRNRDNSGYRDRQDNSGYRDRRDNQSYRDNRNNSNSSWDENRRRDWLAHHRRDTKNEWRNIAIGAGGLGVLGALSHDNTLAVLGGVGALYSLNRYEQDRRSENRADRVRAEYFNRPYFYRDGVRYDRRVVNRDGQRYYQFRQH